MNPIKMTRLPILEKMSVPTEGPTEGARIATGVGYSLEEKENLTFPDAEVPEKKSVVILQLPIFQEANVFDQPGQIYRLLRWACSYSSNLAVWHQSIDKDMLQGMSFQKRTRNYKKKLNKNGSHYEKSLVYWE